jgi:tRNA-specific 2-thiouridylase
VLKFGVLLDCARHHGADRLATGHHVRIRHDAVKGRRRLKRGVEREKDQSYFLYALSQQQLAHVCFPVGGLTKREVRAIARTRGLSCAERKESQDVCFAVSGTPFPELLRRRFGGPARPGAIVDTKGKVLGRHRGVHRYTIGQRKGLGVAASKRLYVVALDSDHAEVVLGGEKELYCRVLKVEDVRWAPGFLLTETFRATVKIRYRHPGAPAVLTPLTDGAVEVVFDTPQRAITDGQAAVFYCGDTVVGGGVISQKNQ